MATLQIKSKYILLALFIALAGLFCLGWGLGHKKTKDALNRLETAQNTISFYKAKVGRDSVFLAQTEQKLVSEREAKKALELTNRDLRAMNIKQANEIDRLKFRIDTLLEDVGHDGTVVIVHDTITNMPNNAILLPFSFEKKDEWLELKGRFDPQGKLDVSLKMDLSVDVITGIEKKTKKPICVLKTDNPYLQTINIASYKTDSQKPKRYGIGLQIGYGVGITEDKSVVATPFIGFGFSYNFLIF